MYFYYLQEASHTCSHLVAFKPVHHWSVTQFGAFSLALSDLEGRAGLGSENQATAPCGMCSEGSHKSNLILASITNG